MNEQMTKLKILELIQTERTALQTTLDRLTPQQMVEPGVESNWSVKDILAHITAWERMMVRWVEESLRGEVPERPAPGLSWDDLDGLNERIYRDNKERALEETLKDAQDSYQRALETVQGMAEEELIDPERFAWRKGDPMWHMVAANTWWHYKEHHETIKNWLEERS